jgi:DNA polymerase-3 subunit delta'
VTAAADTAAPLADPWADMVGQSNAVAQLQASAGSGIHAYLFVGPRGSGKRAAARALAGEILSRGKTGDAAERDRRLARGEHHPDLVVIEPEGALFRGGRETSKGETEGTRFIREVSSSPRESDHKVIVAVDFHTANDEAVGRLLKVIEEPPESTVVVLLADEILPEQVTIASRCVRIDFSPIAEDTMAAALVSEGVDGERAALAARASGGDLGRARLLVEDPGLDHRRDAWSSVPARLDGSGAVIAQLVGELQGLIDAAQAPLDLKQEAEVAALEEQIEQYGERGAGRPQLKERHNRERRRLRTDELLFGLATLAARYRDDLATSTEPDQVVASLAAIQATAESFERNPNETLMLQGLFVRLAALPQ